MKKLALLFFIFSVYIKAEDDVPKLRIINSTHVAINIYFKYPNKNNFEYAIVSYPNEAKIYVLRTFRNEFFDNAKIKITYDPVATQRYALENNLIGLFYEIKNLTIEESAFTPVQKNRSYSIHIENSKFEITEVVE